MGGDSQLFSTEMGQRTRISLLSAAASTCQRFWIFLANRQGLYCKMSWGKLK